MIFADKLEPTPYFLVTRKLLEEVQRANEFERTEKKQCGESLKSKRKLASCTAEGAGPSSE